MTTGPTEAPLRGVWCNDGRLKSAERLNELVLLVADLYMKNSMSAEAFRVLVEKIEEVQDSLYGPWVHSADHEIKPQTIPLDELMSSLPEWRV